MEITFRNEDRVFVIAIEIPQDMFICNEDISHKNSCLPFGYEREPLLATYLAIKSCVAFTRD